VADTMKTCKLWFEQEGVPYTAADLIAAASLVMKRERDHAAQPSGRRGRRRTASMA
jgi:hypothetical protein